MRTSKVILAVAGLGGLTACQAPPHGQWVVLVTEHLPTGGYVSSTGPAASRAQPELLPEGKAVCSAFNLDDGQPGRCSAQAVLAASQQQTDPKLWFTNIASSPYSFSICPSGLPFARAKTTTGTNVTRYLCPAPHRDDTITEPELAAFEAFAKRLNAVDHPTYAEFRQALNVKFIIRAYSAPGEGAAR